MPLVLRLGKQVKQTHIRFENDGNGRERLYHESYYDGAKDTAKEIFAEIRKIVTAIYNKHIFGSDLEDEEKEAVMDFEVDISSAFDELEEKYGITDTALEE